MAPQVHECNRCISIVELPYFLLLRRSGLNMPGSIQSECIDWQALFIVIWNWKYMTLRESGCSDSSYQCVINKSKQQHGNCSFHHLFVWIPLIRFLMWLFLGFGMTTPITLPGRATCIIYGFFGCAGSILTFNTFLERIIVLWTVILRSLNKLFTKVKKLCTPNVVEMER